MKEFKGIKIGDKIPVWWSTNEVDKNKGHIGTIIGIEKYTGRYDFFDCVLRINATKTNSGWVEMAYNTKDFKHEGIRTE